MDPKKTALPRGLCFDRTIVSTVELTEKSHNII